MTDEQTEEAFARAGGEREFTPKFGDVIRGIWASEKNPMRDGYYVQTIRRSGRMNPGTYYQLTDGNGELWQFPAKNTVLISRAAIGEKRGTDAQILKERELTASAIQGAIAFGALGKDGPPDDELNAQWLKPFWELGRRQQRLEAVCRAAKACTDNPRMAGYQGGSLWLRLEAAVQALEEPK